MAEGILRDVPGNPFDVHSAVSRPAGLVHPKAIQVMKEIGIDISAHTSKPMRQFRDHRVRDRWGWLRFTVNGSGWLVVYILAPIVGGLFGGWIYRSLFQPRYRA